MPRPSGSYKSKRSFSASRFSKRNRSGFKRFPRSRLSRSMTNFNHYHFKRHVSLDDITAVAGSGVGGQIEFRLNQIPNYTEFTTLFDSYRINKVVVRFRPSGNQMLTSTNVTTAYVPDFFTVIDYDADVNNPGSADELRQYSTCKYTKGNKNHTRVLVPRLAQTVYRTGVSSAYVEAPARSWVDCAYTDVPHYGIRYWMAPAAASSQFSYHIEATYYFSCKGAR